MDPGTPRPDNKTFGEFFSLPCQAQQKPALTDPVELENVGGERCARSEAISAYMKFLPFENETNASTKDLFLLATWA